MAPIKVLFVAANTNDQATLQLRRELKQIQNFLELTPEGDALFLFDELDPPATRLNDLLLRKQPDIVHFSGHADEAGRLQLPGPGQSIGRITPNTLDGLFSDSTVKLVIFNTCYSAPAAEMVKKQVPFCIGTPDKLGDLIAIHFSASFYQGLGYGKTIAEAFKFANVGVNLAADTLPPNYRPKPDERPKLYTGVRDDTETFRLRSPRILELQQKHELEIADLQRARESEIARLNEDHAASVAAQQQQHRDEVADSDRRYAARTSSLKGSRRLWLGVMSGLLLLVSAAGGIVISGLTSQAAHLTREIQEIGGDLTPPEGYPPKDINLSPLPSQEDPQPQPIEPGNQKTAQRQLMDEWWNDLLTFQRGPIEKLLVLRSDESFAPPYKSSYYKLRVTSDVDLARAAAFLERDAGGDTTYRPVYRQMYLDFQPGKVREGTLYLERPRRGESLLIYLWVTSFRTPKKPEIREKEVRDFVVTLTGMVPQ